MYEGWTRLLIIFLTHPGVIVPIPADGLWSWLRGLWQASWVMVMHSFSEGRNAYFGQVVFWGIFFLMAYVKVQLILMGK